MIPYKLTGGMWAEQLLALFLVVTNMWQSVSDQKPGMSDPLLTKVWLTVIVCTHIINLGLRTHAEIAEEFLRIDLCVISNARTAQTIGV